MAGIEKICELSGEYPSGEMYGYKKNLIQIMPNYRKLFRGVKHELHIFKPSLYFNHKLGWKYEVDFDEMNDYTPPFDNRAEFIEFKKEVEHYRMINEYDYVLMVKDSDLQGNVKGKYMNWTTDLTTTKRKIKRMLRSKSLNIIVHDCSYQEWRVD